MTELDEILEARGYAPRPAQVRLFAHLVRTGELGVIAQAGTGTGKSMAILAAAAHAARESNRQSIIVTPTLTLMNQYRDGDTPWARKAFTDLTFAELRGRSHYYCEMTKSGFDMMGTEYPGGCQGKDAGCSMKGQAGHDSECPEGCLDAHENRWFCEYQDAKRAAMIADVVITNADMLIVNDRSLAPIDANFFDLEGALFVDEAHTLEQKLRDYASRSLHWSSIERFRYASEASKKVLVNWLKNDEGGIALKRHQVPISALMDIYNAVLPEERPKDGLSKQRETQEAVIRIIDFLDMPHDSAVLHVNDGALKYDWINIARSSAELLMARRFALVSATVPSTMAMALGVPDAPFVDVGHPFDYSKQAWIGFSAYGGDFKAAQHDSNFEQRVNEVKDLIVRAKGGALILFSSFRDLERVHDRLTYDLQTMGLTVLKQEREMEAKDRQGLADTFKADGNAVLFGSESFATGFDVPGNALRLVVIWKLPYPAVDPVSNAIRAQSFPRYNDIMKVRAIQGIGRLIRTDEDRGIVWIADARGRRLLDTSDPLTAHIPQFARL